MSEFTPGPWESIIGTSSGKEVVAPNANKGKYRIARCGGADRDANSVLIAAAPDLYEALEELISSISYRMDFHDRNGPHLSCQDGEFIRMDVLEDLTEGVAKARAALVKARGES